MPTCERELYRRGIVLSRTAVFFPFLVQQPPRARPLQAHSTWGARAFSSLYLTVVAISKSRAFGSARVLVELARSNGGGRVVGGTCPAPMLPASPPNASVKLAPCSPWPALSGERGYTITTRERSRYGRPIASIRIECLLSSGPRDTKST